MELGGDCCRQKEDVYNPRPRCLQRPENGDRWRVTDFKRLKEAILVAEDQRFVHESATRFEELKLTDYIACSDGESRFKEGIAAEMRLAELLIPKRSFCKTLYS